VDQKYQQENVHFSNLNTYWLPVREGTSGNNISKRICASQTCYMNTYILRDGKGGNNINKKICTSQTWPLTFWGKAKPATTLARESTLLKQNHWLAEGWKSQQQHQQENLHFSNIITYKLRDNKGGNISKTTCTSQTWSPTYWGKAKVATSSEREPAPVKHNHSHTEKRQGHQ
jgi:hypothetical protein